jgi:aspartate/methionine/tyrosine aminotransferase
MSAAIVADLGLGHVRVADPGVADPGALGAEYGPAEGFPAVREAVAAWERVPVEEVALTTGASLGLVATLATLERPGSVLCPRPHFPAYPRVAGLLGLDVIYYDLAGPTDWEPDPDRLARLARPDTRALLWNYPANPTGGVPTAATLRAVAAVARRADLLVISDEVYADFVYGGRSFPDTREYFPPVRLVRLKSFSKAFGIPGERLGYVAADPVRVRAVGRAHWALAMSPPAAAQALALKSLRSDPAGRVRGLRAILADNRATAARILAGCDRVRFATPAAGIFLWIEVPDCGLDSHGLARACAEEAGVIVMPGSSFGVDDPVYLRASFAAPHDEVMRGFGALASFLHSF